MVTIEEIAKLFDSKIHKYFYDKDEDKIKNKNIKDIDSLSNMTDDNLFGEETKWNPIGIEDYNVPEFKINFSNAHGAFGKRKKKFQEILAFISQVSKMRYKDKCTLMPISQTSSKFLWIWGNQKNISNAIKLMKEIGLIETENSTYRFNAFNSKENYSIMYRYYYENELKFLDYCAKNDIHELVPSNLEDLREYKVERIKKTYNKIINDKYCQFSSKNVVFNSNLNIKKPDDMSKDEFEALIRCCLYLNYPKLRFYQSKVDEINKKFYHDRPEFMLRFIPHITWNKKTKTNKAGTIVKKIGIRLTNSYATMKKENREELLKKLDYDLFKDVKSSVPRITLSLNKGEWVDESIDIYEKINENYCRITGTELIWNDERREAIKKLHMSAYFDCSTNKKAGFHLKVHMKDNSISNNDLEEFMKCFRQAILEAEGGKTYGSEIFYIESSIYLMVLYDLLFSNGHNNGDVWIVYDAFYTKRQPDQDDEIFENMVRFGIKQSFNDFYNMDFKGRESVGEKINI